MPTVLLVDDEHDTLQLLDEHLRAAGFETFLADTAEGALAQLHARVPDVVVLDLVLPDLPGTEVCRWIRGNPRTSAVPVVFCTARGDEIDRVVAFELGADDYIVKPFSMRELVLRLRAVLRRSDGAPRAEQAKIRIGPVELDLDERRCRVAGADVDLTPIEFRLLVVLAARAGDAQPRERLLADVWELGAGAATRTLDSHVKRLRDKLGPARGLLETVRGVGYRFADPDRAHRELH